MVTGYDTNDQVASVEQSGRASASQLDMETAVSGVAPQGGMALHFLEIQRGRLGGLPVSVDAAAKAVAGHSFPRRVAIRLVRVAWSG